jgi:hypothetical protein
VCQYVLDKGEDKELMCVRDFGLGKGDVQGIQAIYRINTGVQVNNICRGEKDIRGDLEGF